MADIKGLYLIKTTPKSLNKYIYILPLFLLCGFLHGQEICDNGIDDDGDNLIDLNDDDCDCFFEFPSGLIPNPSFEEMNCCPNNEAQLDCAVGWVQASGPTTDYVHTCGILGNPFLGKNAPLPFPDGDGAIGFRDGKPGNPNFKEYAGAVLTENMQSGNLYRLDFFTGFPDDDYSVNFDMSLYATEDPNPFLFGGGQINIGCPSNLSGWDLIDRKTVSGRDEWVNVVFEFVANKPYRTIVLGPSCDPHPEAANDPYFFFDRLLLAERAEFGLPYSEITGSVCAEGLSLTVDFEGAISYQWYLNGVALQGLDDSTITLTELQDPEGEYQVVIETTDGCLISQTYEMFVPSYEEMVIEYICEGDSLSFADQMLTEENMYENLFIASDGCDSMVFLDLQILKHSVGSAEEILCEGDVLLIDGFEFEEGGTFDYVIDNEVGCDSTITLAVDLIPANSGLDLQDTIILGLGEYIDIQPNFIDPNIISFSWEDENGNFISDEANIFDYRPFNNSNLILTGYDQFGCTSKDTVDLRVERNINTYIPNIFTPDDQNFNNTFQLFGTPAVEQISEIYIYDRWGELVYSAFNTGPLEQYIGWDGRFKGDDAVNGVYVYAVVLDIVDGTQENHFGDITLIR